MRIRDPASNARASTYETTETTMMVYSMALLIGVIAGLRTMTAPAAIAWAAKLGIVSVAGWLSFFAHPATAWVFTVLAIGELITDQLPSTPSRTVPVQFGARIVSGGVCGAIIGSTTGSLWIGVVLGVIGAIIGTLGGRAARAQLSAKFGKDRPAAIIEDIVAIAGAAVIVTVLARF
jgi:uncharacterized membrane protein